MPSRQWCGHCKRLTPEFAKAAAELKQRDPPLRIAKVDATEEKELGDRFGIRGCGSGAAVPRRASSGADLLVPDAGSPP